MVVVLWAGCTQHRPPPTDPLALGRLYVEDPAFRRQVLEQSLVNPENEYSKLRLARYRESDWGALPEWNPPVAVVSPQPGQAERYERVDLDHVPWEHDALVALGRQVFFRYPVQMQEALRIGLRHPEHYGLWQTSDSVGGAVREVVATGPPRLAVTCATCHASPNADGSLIAGRPNSRFDLGSMLAEEFPSATPRPVWGPGRIDLTDDGINNPVAISDLRALRSERYLHHDATVRNGLIELAIRLETLIITSNKYALRPPRKAMFALALYLWELQPVRVGPQDAASQRGSAIFTKRCARCHAPPEYSGDRVTLVAVGTDDAVGRMADRTTGTYRVPSLRGVGDRSPLFASGQVASVDEVMDPQRKAAGHRYGLDLPATDRGDLVAFLKSLP